MAWSDTQQGQDLAGHWDSLRKLLGTWLPNHQQSLQTLANRPIDR